VDHSGLFKSPLFFFGQKKKGVPDFLSISFPLLSDDSLFIPVSLLSSAISFFGTSSVLRTIQTPFLCACSFSAPSF